MKTLIGKRLIRALNNALILLIVIGFSSEALTQQLQEVEKPEIITQTSAVRYVPSLASRSELKPFKEVIREAKDTRSGPNSPCDELGSTGDDILAMNPDPAIHSTSAAYFLTITNKTATKTR